MQSLERTALLLVQEAIAKGKAWTQFQIDPKEPRWQFPYARYVLTKRLAARGLWVRWQSNTKATSLSDVCDLPWWSPQSQLQRGFSRFKEHARGLMQASEASQQLVGAAVADCNVVVVWWLHCTADSWAGQRVVEEAAVQAYGRHAEECLHRWLLECSHELLPPSTKLSAGQGKAVHFLAKIWLAVPTLVLSRLAVPGVYVDSATGLACMDLMGLVEGTWPHRAGGEGSAAEDARAAVDYFYALTRQCRKVESRSRVSSLNLQAFVTAFAAATWLHLEVCGHAVLQLQEHNDVWVDILQQSYRRLGLLSTWDEGKKQLSVVHGMRRLATPLYTSSVPVARVLELVGTQNDNPESALAQAWAEKVRMCAQTWQHSIRKVAVSASAQCAPIELHGYPLSLSPTFLSRYGAYETVGLEPRAQQVRQALQDGQPTCLSSELVTLLTTQHGWTIEEIMGLVATKVALRVPTGREMLARLGPARVLLLIARMLHHAEGQLVTSSMRQMLLEHLTGHIRYAVENMVSTSHHITFRFPTSAKLLKSLVEPHQTYAGCLIDVADSSATSQWVVDITVPDATASVSLPDIDADSVDEVEQGAFWVHLCVHALLHKLRELRRLELFDGGLSAPPALLKYVRHLNSSEVDANACAIKFLSPSYVECIPALPKVGIETLYDTLLTCLRPCVASVAKYSTHALLVAEVCDSDRLARMPFTLTPVVTSKTRSSPLVRLDQSVLHVWVRKHWISSVLRTYARHDDALPVIEEVTCASLMPSAWWKQAVRLAVERVGQELAWSSGKQYRVDGDSVVFCWEYIVE